MVTTIAGPRPPKVVPNQEAPNTRVVGPVFEETYSTVMGVDPMVIRGRRIDVPHSFPNPMTANVWLRRTAMKLGMSSGEADRIDTLCDCESHKLPIEGYCQWLGLDAAALIGSVGYHRI